MKELSKENLNWFIMHYYDLHDSYIQKINYDVFDSKIELLIDVCLSGKPILKGGKMFQPTKARLRLVLNDIKTFEIKDYFSWDYINKVYIKYIKLDNKEYICFATDEKEPLIYIVCNDIEYEGK